MMRCERPSRRNSWARDGGKSVGGDSLGPGFCRGTDGSCPAEMARHRQAVTDPRPGTQNHLIPWHAAEERYIDAERSAGSRHVTSHDPGGCECRLLGQPLVDFLDKTHGA